MVLFAIIVATLATGIGSVWVAALLMRVGLGGREAAGKLMDHWLTRLRKED